MREFCFTAPLHDVRFNSNKAAPIRATAHLYHIYLFIYNIYTSLTFPFFEFRAPTSRSPTLLHGSPKNLPSADRTNFRQRMYISLKIYTIYTVQWRHVHLHYQRLQANRCYKLCAWSAAVRSVIAVEFGRDDRNGWNVGNNFATKQLEHVLIVQPGYGLLFNIILPFTLFRT